MGSPAYPDLPDWTDAAAYDWLLKVEQAGFAWEWLRRQPRFRDAALESVARRTAGAFEDEDRALAWGLHAFEDPRQAFPIARPVWSSAKHDWVLAAHARIPKSGEDNFDLSDFPDFAKVVAIGGFERLLLSDGYRSIRLDLSGASLERIPVSLSYELSGLRSLDRPLLMLERLRSLAISRRFVNSLYPPVRRARRLVQIMRACDGLEAGATQADLAEAILTPSIERPGWRIYSPSLRSKAQRLAHAARRMTAGEYWELLG